MISKLCGETHENIKAWSDNCSDVRQRRGGADGEIKTKCLKKKLYL